MMYNLKDTKHTHKNILHYHVEMHAQALNYNLCLLLVFLTLCTKVSNKSNFLIIMIIAIRYNRKKKKNNKNKLHEICLNVQ